MSDALNVITIVASVLTAVLIWMWNGAISRRLDLHMEIIRLLQENQRLTHESLKDVASMHGIAVAKGKGEKVLN